MTLGASICPLHSASVLANLNLLLAILDFVVSLQLHADFTDIKPRIKELI